jgi:hypothetical protein
MEKGRTKQQQHRICIMIQGIANGLGRDMPKSGSRLINVKKHYYYYFKINGELQIFKIATFSTICGTLYLLAD